MHWIKLKTFWRPLLGLAAAALLSTGCISLFRPLLANVSVEPALISPNADGSDDVTRIRYTLGRNADLSITFTDAAGQAFAFRARRPRSAGEYEVLWGGVVNQLRVLDGAAGRQAVDSWVLPDGAYTWAITAAEANGSSQQITGTITLQGGDTELPLLNNFMVVPQEFRPNQDGLRDDWVSISYYLTKPADAVNVYLVHPAQPDVKYYLPESERVIKPGEMGYHEYRYEGGVDKGAEPPPDGAYTIVGEARDLAGNHVVVSSTLTIQEGGKPRADILQGEIEWQNEVNRVVGVPLGSTLCFTATVANQGTVPIRTAGPWPGQTYRFSQNYNTLAIANNDKSWHQQAGAWRFGVNFDTTGVDFPFRWAIGRPQDLERRVIDGTEQYYLLPGQRGQVSGCIEFDEAPPSATNFWWGGLIHEFVAVANNYVDRISVEVGQP